MTAIQIATELTAKQLIHQVASQNGIVHNHSPLDKWGNMIAKLSDSEVELDETQWLLVELNRVGILTGQENSRLHFQYLQERDG